MKAALLALALTVAAPAAHAASFDCAKARTKVEKEVCASPELSHLDAALAAAYRAVMARTPTPGEVSLHQRWWLRERDAGPEGVRPGGPLTGEALVRHYRDRLDALNVIRRRDAAAPASFARVRLGKACTPMIKPCQVFGSGRVRGGAGAPVLFHQLERQLADDAWETGVVVFEPAGADALRPVLWTYGYGSHDAPRLVSSPAGWLLLVPWQDEETRGETPFRLVGGRWRDIDMSAMDQDLQKRAGPDRWAADPEFDWTRFSAAVPLRWTDGREGSAGTARFSYALDGDRFVVREFRATPAR